MIVTCHKCGGDGYIPEYSWNKGGVCFACGGDGKINTFPTKRITSKTPKELASYLKYTMTRDLAEFKDFLKLDREQQTIFSRELRERANKLDVDTSSDDITTIQKKLLKVLNEREENMPQPWKNTALAKAGKVALVPVRWLSKFQGNSLRHDSKEMKELAEDILKNGLKEPVHIEIGQEDRKVGIGEGNHRTFAFIEAGLDYIPATVYRNSSGKTYSSTAKYYDKMHSIPKDDYIPANMNPYEVFDTFYDGDYLPEEPEYDPTQDGYIELNNDLLGKQKQGTTFGDEFKDLDTSDVDLVKDYGIKKLYTKQKGIDETNAVIYLREIVKMSQDMHGKETTLDDLNYYKVVNPIDKERGYYELDMNGVDYMYDRLIDDYEEFRN